MQATFAPLPWGHRPHLFLGLFLALLCATDCVAARAQEQKTEPPPVQQSPTVPANVEGVTGQLHDAAGAPVPNAIVNLDCQGDKQTATTAADGRFTVHLFPTGTCNLSVSVNQRTVAYPRPIALNAPNASINITLSGAGTDAAALSILLGGPAPAASTTSGANSGGEQLSSTAVSSLPLNKRDFSQLLLLAAGTSTDANGATNFTAQFAINGQRGVEATFAMDGADISDPEMGGATFSNFNVDAVEGIQSSSGWMPAEIGRGGAGLTNILTRSGSSGFHGSFFEFLRNSSLDARNYFDHPSIAEPGRIPPFRRNEFGFTNGGPVVIPHLYNGAKKTFYFGQYQGFRQVLGTTQVFPVPTLAQRPAEGCTTGCFVNDPVTYKLADGSTTTDTLYVPVDPAIIPILNRYPKPNLPTGAFGLNTYAASSKVVTNANQFSIRLDHAVTSKDQFLARFNFNNLTGPTTNPDQTAIDPSFGITYIDRQRNVMGSWTHTTSPTLVFESLLSITRSTPGFITPNRTDPAVKFNDALYEAFNSAAGSVMQAYGNLFHGRQLVTWTHAGHVLKFGAELRFNRDTTYFGISPNGEYDFGGGSAYSTTAIASASGTHNVPAGGLLPDTVSGFLTGSPAAYSVAIAPSGVSDGAHIGPAAINRNSYTLFAQDTWKVTPRLTLDYGLRWELYTPITERAKRTGGFLRIDGKQQYLVNPRPGYATDWKGFGPRVQATWQVTPKLQVHAGGGITIIPPNIWQDNFLTGSTPYAIYPRLVSAQNAPIPYGYTITPAELPAAYTPTGQRIATNAPKTVPANTILDVDRYEKDLAALGKSDVVSALNLSGIRRGFANARLYTWTAGFERPIGKLTADVNYVGTTSNHLPRISFPNAYPYASPGFAPDTEFNTAGAVIGGLGVENVIDDSAHSSYHALQTSLSGTVPHGGPGIQASYTWGKSIDDASLVTGGTGSTGAVVPGVSQNPYDTHPEKGPSNFDTTHGFTLSLAQDLHGEEIGFLRPVSRKVTQGWELLSISSISSGAPFTILSGVQQTGYGTQGADRPDQIGKPKLSTARKVREDYFGLGDNNQSFFNIPIKLADGGSGPNDGRFGTLGRNTFRGPAFYNFDFSLIKDTPFGTRKSGAELVDLQFRSEFFNLFNIVNMGLPANTIDGSGFGEISKTAGTSRQIQFSLKLIY